MFQSFNQSARFSMKTYSLTCRAALTLFVALGALVQPVASADTPTKHPLAAAVQPFVDHHTLAGAVMLVADKDKILAIDEAGYADIASKSLMGANTVFWIASQSKPITAAALMLLFDEGKFKLDDPVEKFLPEFKDIMVMGPDKKLQKPSHPITIREIMSHTGGLAFSSPQENPTLDGLTLRDAVLSYAKQPLQSQPGTKWSYSNEGINTGGRLIEVLSGMPYEVFLEKRLLAPLGMKDTTFWPNEEQVQRLAMSYRPVKDKLELEEIKISQLKYPLTDPKRQPMPAGGLFSTATDVAHFCQMMLGGGVYQGKRILSEEAVKLLTTKQTPPPLKDGYGLGFATNGGGFGHGGAMSTDMWIDTNRGLIFVWMVQHAGFPGNGGQSREAFRKAAAETFKSVGR
jgi:CubicO group peptidase (beta-lactamase class C family)